MINIFIGSEPKQHRAEEVLIHSLHKYHRGSELLNITVMRTGDPGWDDWINHGPTQFTLFRFAIPELMDFKGFAIYLDCDMLCLADIEDLFMCGRGGKWLKSSIGGANGDCVSVIDCSAVKRLKRWPSIQELKTKGLRKWDVRPMLAPILEDGVPNNWQVCDDFVPGKTNLIHFTALDTQPWFTENKPHPSPVAVEHWLQHFAELS